MSKTPENLWKNLLKFQASSEAQSKLFIHWHSHIQHPYLCFQVFYHAFYGL